MVIDFVIAFLALIILVLLGVLLWAALQFYPRKAKIESKVRRSRRKMNLVLDEDDGALYQVVRSRKLGEFRWLLSLKGANGITIRKIVNEWQLSPANSLTAVAGNNPAVWNLKRNPTASYSELKKKYQEMYESKQKVAGSLAIAEAEERELAREMTEQAATLLGKIGKKEDSSK